MLQLSCATTGILEVQDLIVSNLVSANCYIVYIVYYTVLQLQLM